VPTGPLNAPDVPGDSTRALHAGRGAARRAQPFAAGPVLAAPYHLDPVTGPRPGEDSYGRTGNPGWRALESTIADLEGAAEAVVFASGMAAITALLFTTLRPGDTVMLPSDGYYKTRAVVASRLVPFGVRATEVPTAGPYPSMNGVRLLLLESPANPGLDVCDIAALAERAHAAGALVAVDNTTATPLGQTPLRLGADIVVASGTKALTGHSDLLMGYVGADAGTAAVIRGWRDDTGAIPSGFDAWLALRSLATLDLRLTRQAENAAALADLLATHPAVTSVRFPGRPDDPSYAIASRQMRRISGVVTFTLPDEAFVARFLGASRLVAAATSFGGLHTNADRRAQWGDAVPAGLVRLSCGIEDTADLLADVSAALAAAAESG